MFPLKKKKKKGIAGQHSREVICEAPCLLRCSYSSGIEWDILYRREMSPSLGPSKPLWERNAPLGPERENQRDGKGVPVSHMYTQFRGGIKNREAGGRTERGVKSRPQR